MDQKAGAQISKKAFIQPIAILFILMMVAGILTFIIPAGQYSHFETNGHEMIDPNSSQFIDRPDFPIWRWFVASIEVLDSESGLTAIIIIIVVLFFTAGFRREDTCTSITRYFQQLNCWKSARHSATSFTEPRMDSR